MRRCFSVIIQSALLCAISFVVISCDKGYYWTSSNPSLSKTATISGTLITANISGLKAGTEYYVKCVATGKGGTTTTTVTKCITNYDY